MTIARAAAATALLAVLLAGCEREQRRFAEIAPATGRSGGDVRATARSPGASAPAPAVADPYDDNAWAIGEGQRLYNWFNCNDCHGMGGGGMGPALMDDVWIYGSEPQAIFTSIVEGRPNGMPAFGGKVADQQVWQLVAYVRTLSALQRKDVRPGRPDAMQVRPAPVMTPPSTPTVAAPPAPSRPPR
jgi:cytochrome c oxidase cbb3-type subunit 3